MTPVIVLVVMNLLVTGIIIVAYKKLTRYVVEGHVEADRDPQGRLLDVRLVMLDGWIYHAELDAQGRKLGTEMEGRKVRARGKLRKKDGRRVLMIESCEETEATVENPFEDAEDTDRDIHTPRTPMGAAG